MFSVLVMRLRSLRLLRVRGLVMRLRLLLLVVIVLSFARSFRHRLRALWIRIRRLRVLRVSGIVMLCRMWLLLITFLKASHSFRNRLLVICKNAYLFATMIMTIVFFFSSRRRHTRSYGDWSSDVCSSDLRAEKPAVSSTRCPSAKPCALFSACRPWLTTALGRRFSPGEPYPS